MNKRAVIFDLDGTLLDTLEDLKAALDHTLAAFGYPLRTLEEVRRFVGNGIPNLIERATSPDAPIQEMLDVFLPYYQLHNMDKTRPYEGVSEMLDRLKARGRAMAIVTNKVHAASRALCGRFFPQVDVVVGSQPGLANKPAPDMVRSAMEQLGVGPEEITYVGDSEVDLATARNAGLDCVCVTWGFRDKEELERQGGTVFAADPGELARLLG